MITATHTPTGRAVEIIDACDGRAEIADLTGEPVFPLEASSSARKNGAPPITHTTTANVPAAELTDVRVDGMPAADYCPVPDCTCGEIIGDHAGCPEHWHLFGSVNMPEHIGPMAYRIERW